MKAGRAVLGILLIIFASFGILMSGGLTLPILYLLYTLLVIGFVIVGITLVRALGGKPSTLKETQPVREIIREKETIREIVKIPCRHCGSLVPQEQLKCPNCGAPLRR